jgi:hypothetical protein
MCPKSSINLNLLLVSRQIIRTLFLLLCKFKFIRLFTFLHHIWSVLTSPGWNHVCLGAILKMYPGMLSAQLLGRLLPEIEKSSNIRDPCLSPSPRTASRLLSHFGTGILWPLTAFCIWTLWLLLTSDSFWLFVVLNFSRSYCTNMWGKREKRRIS